MYGVRKVTKQEMAEYLKRLRSGSMVGVLAQKWIKAERAKRIKESKKDANEKLLDEMERGLVEVIKEPCKNDRTSKVKKSS